MEIKTFHDKQVLGTSAAEQAAAAIRAAIRQRGKARIIAATGVSQFEFLEALTALPNLDWSRVEMFHLDEYVGIPETHPASFCRFLRERLIEKTGITNFHLLDGKSNPVEVIRQVGQALQSAPIDVAFVGIGENGHLAFNDPPADFETEAPYLIVTLDEVCRRQQMGEGWFVSLEEVPKQAMSMGIRQILKSEEIICIVPDSRKANAVKACLEGDISPMAPASILRTHPHTTVYLDQHSAALLSADASSTVK
ncbi:MAG: glucosamine-6-phosphate deaminase [Acidobacteria bacterium]|nr:glucosamine-6-phosphate deaminase [Acidobacteriota bacterium]